MTTSHETQGAERDAPRFRFACQRSGRCCTHGEGHVWVDERELASLAAELGIEPGEFARRFAREVTDPVGGGRRTSLREEAGRCVLLEGTNECRAYAARPRQCRSFPRWKAVLTDRETFERTRAICPGIAVVVDTPLRERARLALEAWFARRAPVDAGEPCPFPDRGCDAHATGLEVDVALQGGTLGGSKAPGCPFWGGAGCGAGALRPLACRPAFRAAQDGEQREVLWRGLRALERSLDYPAATGRIAGLVESRLAEEVRP